MTGCSPIKTIHSSLLVVVSSADAPRNPLAGVFEKKIYRIHFISFICRTSSIIILPPSVPLHPPKPPPSQTPFSSTQVGCLLPTKDIFLSSSSEETDEEIEEHQLILLIPDRERLFSEEAGNPLIRSLRCQRYE